MGDKVSASEKADIEAKLGALKEAIKGGNVDDIKAKQDELQKAFYAVSEKVYKEAATSAQAAQGAQSGPAPDAGSASGSNGDNVVDADYKEV